MITPQSPAYGRRQLPFRGAERQFTSSSPPLARGGAERSEAEGLSKIPLGCGIRKLCLQSAVGCVMINVACGECRKLIWKRIEVVITSRTRNAVVRSGHVGSNPTASAKRKEHPIGCSFRLPRKKVGFEPERARA